MNAPATFPITQHKGETTPFLGLRSAIERAAEVERLSQYAPHMRGWWQQDCRIKDADDLRRRLEERLVVPVRVNSREMGGTWKPAETIARFETHARIDRICKAAMRRMKRADDAYAQGKLNLTPVRGDAA